MASRSGYPLLPMKGSGLIMARKLSAWRSWNPPLPARPADTGPEKPCQEMHASSSMIVRDVALSLSQRPVIAACSALTQTYRVRRCRKAAGHVVLEAAPSRRTKPADREADCSTRKAPAPARHSGGSNEPQLCRRSALPRVCLLRLDEARL